MPEAPTTDNQQTQVPAPTNPDTTLPSERRISTKSRTESLDVERYANCRAYGPGAGILDSCKLFTANLANHVVNSPPALHVSPAWTGYTHFRRHRRQSPAAQQQNRGAFASMQPRRIRKS
eukprot:1448441-Pleurochrysis_carterae.AAC.1